MDAAEIINAILESDDEFDTKAFIKSHGQQLDGPSRKHLFVSSSDGGLYDTRKTDWHKGPPIRQNFQKHSARIFNVKDFKATWRARHQTNYTLAFLTDDGAYLCEQCVEKNLERIMRSIRGHAHDGWQVQGVGICHGSDADIEDYHSQCAHCNKNLGEVA